jgi:hypothetical protein
VEALVCGAVSERWLSLAHVLEVRTLVRCYKALLDEHTAWLRRVQATLFHHSAWEPASALFLPVTLTVAGFGFSIGAWAGCGHSARRLGACGLGDQLGALWWGALGARRWWCPPDRLGVRRPEP